MFVTRCNNFVTNEKEFEIMLNKFLKSVGLLTLCAAMAVSAPVTALADEKTSEAETVSEGETESGEEAVSVPEDTEYQTSTIMQIRVEDSETDVYAEPDEESEVIGQASQGNTYEILEMVDGQWARVTVGEYEGYLNTVTIAATMAETVEEVAVDRSEQRRAEIVEFGKQFVGGRYVWGGTDPNKGVDCSGFTRYIMKHAAGVELSHSSRAQSGEGRAVSAAEIRPGDLVFYGPGSRINHVGMYIGDGQIVHASNESNGIRISKWNYRTPVKIVNVLGD